MKNEKLHFYLLRLRNSSLPELIYRAKQFYFLKKLKRQISENKNSVTVPIIDCKDVKDLHLPSFHGQASENLIQEILSRQFFTLNTDAVTIKKFEEDHRQFFFADIKPFDRHFDIRAVWEPARLQHLVILLKYISQTKEASDVHIVQQFVKDSVVDWIHKNPFLLGPHYISAMECGLRIPAFFYCLKSLDNLDIPEYQKILDTIYRHGWWISKRLSLYSSLGNHTVAECVGLIFAGAIFRKTKEGRQWLKTGCELLKMELDHQILDDWGPAEQSFNYHRFVLDLYWLSIDFLAKNDLHNCNDFKERLIQAERFITAFEDTRGRLPSIGDSDDGHAIAPGLYPLRIKPDKKNVKIQTFSTSGYTTINDNNVVLTFDHGPLGMAPLYNHGHADALSITLSVDNKKLLVDPGTYRYNGEPEFRKYFKGTRAHNTVTIDGLDQAVQETGFIWSRPFHSKLLNRYENDDILFLKGLHNGYARLKKPIIHNRSILLIKNSINRNSFYQFSYILISDTFEGKGEHSFELNFHIHPEASINKNEEWWQIENQGSEIFILLTDDVDFKTVCGRKDLIFGWYSPTYGIKIPCNVLTCIKRGTPQAVNFKTIIAFENPFK